MMQYLKPELLERTRSLDDVAEAAAKEWEEALAEYNAALDSLRSVLPAGVRALLARYSLHDARILSISEERRRPRLTLLVQLEGKPARPGNLLELHYLLARSSKHPGFVLVGGEKPEQDIRDKGRIQYDEIGKVADDPVAVFAHSLLLQGGGELRIQFTEMRIRTLQRVILPSVEPLGLAMAR
jgi:hypothetical protein